MKGLKTLGAVALVAATTAAAVVCAQIAMEKMEDEYGRELSFIDKCKKKFLPEKEEIEF